MASHIVLNLRSNDSWSNYSESDELISVLFATGIAGDVGNFTADGGETYSADGTKDRDPSRDIPMSSLSLRRKMDAISFNA